MWRIRSCAETSVGRSRVRTLETDFTLILHATVTLLALLPSACCTNDHQDERVNVHASSSRCEQGIHHTRRSSWGDDKPKKERRRTSFSAAVPPASKGVEKNWSPDWATPADLHDEEGDGETKDRSSVPSPEASSTQTPNCLGEAFQESSAASWQTSPDQAKLVGLSLRGLSRTEREAIATDSPGVPQIVSPATGDNRETAAPESGISPKFHATGCGLCDTYYASIVQKDEDHSLATALALVRLDAGSAEAGPHTRIVDCAYWPKGTFPTTTDWMSGTPPFSLNVPHHVERPSAASAQPVGALFEPTSAVHNAFPALRPQEYCHVLQTGFTESTHGSPVDAFGKSCEQARPSPGIYAASEVYPVAYSLEIRPPAAQLPDAPQFPSCQSVPFLHLQQNAENTAAAGPPWQSPPFRHHLYGSERGAAAAQLSHAPGFPLHQSVPFFHLQQNAGNTAAAGTPWQSPPFRHPIYGSERGADYSFEAHKFFEHAACTSVEPFPHYWPTYESPPATFLPEAHYTSGSARNVFDRPLYFESHVYKRDLESSLPPEPLEIKKNNAGALPLPPRLEWRPYTAGREGLFSEAYHPSEYVEGTSQLRLPHGTYIYENRQGPVISSQPNGRRVIAVPPEQLFYPRPPPLKCPSAQLGNVRFSGFSNGSGHLDQQSQQMSTSVKPATLVAPAGTSAVEAREPILPSMLLVPPLQVSTSEGRLPSARSKNMMGYIRLETPPRFRRRQELQTSSAEAFESK